MKLTSCVALLAVVGGTLALSAGHAETPEEWIKLGARVHGGFGAFIPAGIRIGLDALEQLKAEPRGVTVTFYTGEKAPCPCIADGVMLATQASPGQGTLQVAAEKAPPGLLAVVIVRDRKSGAGVRYSISDEWMGKIARLEQGARSGRALRGGHGGARTIRCRGCPVTGCGAKATHSGRMRRTLTQGLATGDGLIAFRCPVTGVSS